MARISLVEWFNCAHLRNLKEMIHMHLGDIKDSTNQSRADLSSLWSLEVPVTSLRFRGQGSVALPPGSFG